MKSHQLHQLLIAAAGALFFLPFLGGVHLFDWDEINFAEVAREMIASGDYMRVQIDYEPFWEKPPFFFWLQVLSMKLFGVGEYAARFPNAICGILTLVFLYRVGRKLWDERMGLLWAGAYFGSILPHLYFKSGIIDPWFNLFIFSSLYHWILFHWKRNHVAGISLDKSARYYLIVSGLMMGMAMLTKGPTAFLVFTLIGGVYWVWYRLAKLVSIWEVFLFGVLAALPSMMWYGVEVARQGPGFLVDFVLYLIRLASTEDAGHGGFPGYHVVVLLVGCFPISIFAIGAMLPFKESHPHHRDLRQWMLIMVGVVVVLFSLVQSKIVHYSSLAYFPLTYLGARVWYGLIESKHQPSRWMTISFWVIGSLFAAACLLLPILGSQPETLLPYVQDPNVQEILKYPVSWGGMDFLPGILWFVLLIVTQFFFSRKQHVKAIGTLIMGIGLLISVTLIFFIQRIEGYSQEAAIAFFEEKEKEDAYLISFGYKTYAQLFYGRKSFDPDHPKTWQTAAGALMNEELDKDLYVVTKIHKADQLKEVFPQMVEIGRDRGFVFFKKEKVKIEGVD
ncbi:MAG: glycosyltransferase family 39 protein [Bacteroidota bacterium]